MKPTCKHCGLEVKKSPITSTNWIHSDQGSGLWATCFMANDNMGCKNFSGDKVATPVKCKNCSLLIARGTNTNDIWFHLDDDISLACNYANKANGKYPHGTKAEPEEETKNTSKHVCFHCGIEIIKKSDYNYNAHATWIHSFKSDKSIKPILAFSCAVATGNNSLTTKAAPSKPEEQSYHCVHCGFPIESDNEKHWQHKPDSKNHRWYACQDVFQNYGKNFSGVKYYADAGKLTNAQLGIGTYYEDKPQPFKQQLVELSNIYLDGTKEPLRRFVHTYDRNKERYFLKGRRGLVEVLADTGNEDVIVTNVILHTPSPIGYVRGKVCNVTNRSNCYHYTSLQNDLTVNEGFKVGDEWFEMAKVYNQSPDVYSDFNDRFVSNYAPLGMIPVNNQIEYAPILLSNDVSLTDGRKLKI